MYGRVAHFPHADPAYQILSTREAHEWRKPTGETCTSWLQQVDQHLKEMGMDQTSVCGMAPGVLAENGCSDVLL